LGDGRIALGMVARATSENRRGGQRRQVRIGRRCACVVWCGGGWQSGSLAVWQGASLLCPAPPDSCTPDEAALFDDTQGTITHTITHAERCHGYLPCASLAVGSTTTEPERLTAPVVQCECSTHTLVTRSLTHSLTHTLSPYHCST
jgi:hypothetical protein